MLLKNKCFHLIVALLLFIPLAAPSPKPAALGTLIRVTTTADELRNDGDCSLREAVQAANTNKAVDRCPAGSDYDTIRLPQGTFKLSIQGISEDQNRTGDLDLRANIKIEGAGRDTTIIDAAGIDRVLDVPSSGVSILLQTLTLRGGRLNEGDSSNNYALGGGIRNMGKVTLSNVKVMENSVGDGANGYGGGAYNRGTMIIDNSNFSSNVADASGGALGNEGKLTITRTNFHANRGYASGGLYTFGSGAVVEIYNGRFTFTESGPAGNTLIDQGEGSSTLISGTVFEDNVGHEETLVFNRGSLNIRGCTFRRNGGGSDSLMWSELGQLIVYENEIVDNSLGGPNSALIQVHGGKAVLDRSALYGGKGSGLLVLDGAVKVHNSTLYGLTNDRLTGAIDVRGGSVIIDSVTVSEFTGGGHALDVRRGTVSVHNTILARTFIAGKVARQPDCAISAPGVVTSVGYNLVGNSEGCNWPYGNMDQTGGAGNPIEPLLDGMKNNGGATSTAALLSGSPAIDQGDPVNHFKTDQRKYARPAGKQSDIGAYEAGSQPASAAAPNAESETE